MTTKPIKRSKALVRFSQEHHYNLLLIWQIKEGLRNSIKAERISDFVLFFFDQELEGHLNNEEEDLFNKLPPDNELLEKVLDDHNKIKRLIGKIRNDRSSIQLLLEFAENLENHIRFEERIMFNYMQDNFSEVEMFELAAKYGEKPTDVTANWEDKFWITKK
jgi:iron-sulfur cluster repair protein YtfE (RIC family)